MIASSRNPTNLENDTVPGEEFDSQVITERMVDAPSRPANAIGESPTLPSEISAFFTESEFPVGRRPSLSPFAESVAAAVRLDIEPKALGCNGNKEVADLGGGVVAYKVGDTWRVTLHLVSLPAAAVMERRLDTRDEE